MESKAQTRSLKSRLGFCNFGLRVFAWESRIWNWSLEFGLGIQTTWEYDLGVWSMDKDCEVRTWSVDSKIVVWSLDLE